MKMFRLKTIAANADHPKGACAASKCTAASEVTDATKNVWPVEVSLCDRHFGIRCDVLDEEYERAREERANSNSTVPSVESA